jgi:DNA-binding CsgD family transcriptional regulator
MRQQLRQLDVLEQAAGLSPREAQVFRRVRKNMTDAEIAAELNITTNNVYVTKHNAIKKMTKARKAAGF